MCENAHALVNTKLSEGIINSRENYSKDEKSCPDVGEEGSVQKTILVKVEDLLYEY